MGEIGSVLCKSSFFLGLFFFAFQIVGQVNSDRKYEPCIDASIMMANSHVPSAIDGNKKNIIFPTWGLDINYHFFKRWAVSFQSDVKLQSFEVEENDVILKRHYPFTSAIVIHGYVMEHWSFYVGPGYEFESHRNLLVLKSGSEYNFEITDNFEIALNLSYENKQQIYDSWTFGVSFTKKLWEK